MAQRSDSEASAVASPTGNPIVATILAWLVPGLGHLYLRRYHRAALYALLVIGSLVIGWRLGGDLPWTFSGSPMSVLATLGGLGSGLPHLALRFVLGYEGDPHGAGWEYGKAFFMAAGLMNLILMLNAWDIAVGREQIVAADAIADGVAEDDDSQETA